MRFPLTVSFFEDVRLSPRVEIVSFQHWPDRTGYFKVQVAVNNQLAWPFDIAEMDWKEMTEGERIAYLERSGSTLLARYGDAREIRVREDGEIVSKDSL